MKRVALVVHDFPPHGGGGVMRSLKFAKYLPQFGWQPIVITAPPFAYDRALLDSNLESEVGDVRTIRPWYPSRWLFLKGRLAPSSSQAPMAATPSLSRQLKSLAKRLMVPDMEVPWVVPAYAVLSRLHHAEGIDAVLTTNPPNSAHLVGYLAKRLLGIPWVMDFRDQWCGNPVFACSGWRNRIERDLEKACLQTADALVSATPSITDHYRAILPNSKLSTITNGFDAEDFEHLKREFPSNFTVAHVGSMASTYNFHAFLQAWKDFIVRRALDPRTVTCKVVGPIYGFDLSGDLAQDNVLKHSVSLRPFISHSEALVEMISASALLLLVPQGSFGANILTGKLFEYMASHKPIIAVTPPGALAVLLANLNLGQSFSPDQVSKMSIHLEALYDRHVSGTLGELVAGRDVTEFDRKTLTERLADVLDSVIRSSTPLRDHSPKPESLVQR